MQFFRDRKLAKRFHNCDVSEKEQMLYVLFVFLFTAVFTTSYVGHFNWGETIPNKFNYITDITMLLTTAIIVTVCYNTNKKGDNCAFVSRFISISFPVMIQASILGFFLGPIAAMCDLTLEMIINNPELLAAENPKEAIPDLDIAAGPSLVVAIITLSVYVLWRMNSSMKIAAGVRD